MLPGTYPALLPIRVHHPSQLTRRLLVFIPPATADALTREGVGPDRLVAHSKSIQSVDLVESPRPVYNLAEVVQVLSEQVTAVAAGGGGEQQLWQTMASHVIQQIENEAAIGSDETLVERNLLWVVTLVTKPGTAGGLCA